MRIIETVVFANSQCANGVILPRHLPDLHLTESVQSQQSRGNLEVLDLKSSGMRLWSCKVLENSWRKILQSPEILPRLIVFNQLAGYFCSESVNVFKTPEANVL